MRERASDHYHDARRAMWRMRVCASADLGRGAWGVGRRAWVGGGAEGEGRFHRGLVGDGLAGGHGTGGWVGGQWAGGLLGG